MGTEIARAGLKTIRNTGQFVLRYCPRCIMHSPAARLAGIKTHPLRPKILHTYANRDPNTLWWRVSANNVPVTSVARSWCARRARRAFRQALYERGFDDEGRRILQEYLENNTGMKTAIGLRGTAEIIANKSSMTAAYSEVVEDMATLVDTLIRINRHTHSDDHQTWKIWKAKAKS